MSLFNDIVSASSANLALIPIKYKNGLPSKAPSKGWNLPRSAENPHGYTSDLSELNREIQASGSLINFGLHHGSSHTLALDLDDFERSLQVFNELDLPIQDWLIDDGRLEIKSPKPNRGKLIFRLPKQFKADGVKQFKHDSGVIFELRCGAGAQDVLIGEHPEGGQYQIIGDLAAIPAAPDALLDMLEHWDAWKPCFDSAMGIEPEIKIVESAQAQAGNLSGLAGNLSAQQRDPIKEFNQAYSVERVLLDNGYRKAGKDRFIRPNSSSSAPAVALMRNCTDGIERVYSHGGDALNDGFAHDAFDVHRLLNCNGELKLALNWNPEITKHNQRLYMESQATVAPVATVATSSTLTAGDAQQFKLVRVSELTAQPKPVDWLLDGFLEAGSLNLLFGAPASGKSLFAFDWAWCIASGRDWLGHETQKRGVVVLAGEGHSGLRRRMRALEVKYNQRTTDNLLVSEIPANLTDQTAMVWVADAIKQNCTAGGLVIVDTLNRNIGAADENNAKDIATLLNLIDGYIRSMGIAVLIVHHSGHLDKDRARGSSAIKAAVDAEFCVTKTPESIVLKCSKSKDFEPPKPMQFNLTVTELGDAWREKSGEPITSVYLEYNGEQTAGDTKISKLNKRDEQILHELYNAIDKHGIPATAEIKAKFAGFDTLTSLGGEKKVVYVDYWEELVLPLLDAPKAESNKSTFRRSRKSLFERGKVANFNNYWWPI